MYPSLKFRDGTRPTHLTQPFYLHPWPDDLPCECCVCGAEFRFGFNLTIGSGKIERLFHRIAYFGSLPFLLLGGFIIPVIFPNFNGSLHGSHRWWAIFGGMFFPPMFFGGLSVVMPKTCLIECKKCGRSHDYKTSKPGDYSPLLSDCLPYHSHQSIRMTEETTFWKGSPSQWLNSGPFSIAILFAAGITTGAILIPFHPAFFGLIIPFFYALWRYLTVRCETFELTTERLRITRGIMNQTIDEVELYRVKDIVVKRKWWMRITGLGNVHLQTSDRSLPNIEIPAIRNCIGMREELRKLVEALRDKKHIREMDFDEAAGENHIGDIEGMEDTGDLN